MSFSNPPPEIETPAVPEEEKGPGIAVVISACDMEAAYMAFREQVRHNIKEHGQDRQNAELAVLSAMAMQIAHFCDKVLMGLDSFNEVMENAWTERDGMTPVLNDLVRRARNEAAAKRNDPLTPSS